MTHIMDEVVDELCLSMKDDPNRWEINTYDVKDKLTGIKYCTGRLSMGGGINSIWKGSTAHQVFNDEQATKLEWAYHMLCKTQGNACQQMILRKMKDKAVNIEKNIEVDKPWWKFWS